MFLQQTDVVANDPVLVASQTSENADGVMAPSQIELALVMERRWARHEDGSKTQLPSSQVEVCLLSESVSLESFVEPDGGSRLSPHKSDRMEKGERCDLRHRRRRSDDKVPQVARGKRRHEFVREARIEAIRCYEGRSHNVGGSIFEMGEKIRHVARSEEDIVLTEHDVRLRARLYAPHPGEGLLRAPLVAELDHRRRPIGVVHRRNGNIAGIVDDNDLCTLLSEITREDSAQNVDPFESRNDDADR